MPQSDRPVRFMWPLRLAQNSNHVPHSRLLLCVEVIIKMEIQVNVSLQSSMNRPFYVSNCSLVVTLDVGCCAQDVNFILILSQRLLHQRPILVVMLAGEYRILREHTDLHEAVVLELFLQRDSGFNALRADYMIDFNKGTHGCDTCLNTFSNELGAAEGKVGDLISGFGFRRVGECFLECAGGGCEIL